MRNLFLAVSLCCAFATPLARAATPDVIAAAQKEGTLTWYSTAPLDASQALSKAFQAKYGIQASMFRGGTFEVYQRVAAEQQAHRPIADVVHGSDVPGFVALTRTGLLQRYDSPERAAYPAYAKDAGGYWTALRATVSIIVYNTDKLGTTPAPASWKDMLAPAWKGRIAMSDAGFSGTVLNAVAALRASLGPGYMAALGKQDLAITQGTGPALEMILRGERDANVMEDDYVWYSTAVMKHVANLTAVYPAEGVPLALSPVGIVMDAPHPQAARLFVDFVLSAEGQKLIVDLVGSYSLRNGFPQLPGKRPMAELHLIQPEAADFEKNQQQILREYRQDIGTK